MPLFCTVVRRSKRGGSEGRASHLHQTRLESKALVDVDYHLSPHLTELTALDLQASASLSSVFGSVLSLPGSYASQGQTVSQDKSILAHSQSIELHCRRDVHSQLVQPDTLWQEQISWLLHDPASGAAWTSLAGWAAQGAAGKQEMDR